MRAAAVAPNRDVSDSKSGPLHRQCVRNPSGREFRGTRRADRHTRRLTAGKAIANVIALNACGATLLRTTKLCGNRPTRPETLWPIAGTIAWARAKWVLPAAGEEESVSSLTPDGASMPNTKLLFIPRFAPKVKSVGRARCAQAYDRIELSSSL